MTKNNATLQGIVSIGVIICLVAGWFQIFPKEISDFLYQKMFYILIGVSFILMAQTYPNKNLTYVAYLAAAICIVGPFLPENIQFIKTIGLLVGVLITFFARPRQLRN